MRAGDRALFFMTMILTVASNLTIAIGVGTFAGLALRLSRRETNRRSGARPIVRSCSNVLCGWLPHCKGSRAPR